MIENAQEHKEGPSWNITSRFATFEEADRKRLELLNEENLQVKIQWMRKRDDFAVKTRSDPAVALLEEEAQRREAKKRRKAKLSKKRRKK
jgi:hypothetical protein